jgi:membrane associated rhomboid family serine protease
MVRVCISGTSSSQSSTYSAGLRQLLHSWHLASGAIAGVLGAYILLFPQGKVRVLQGQQVIQVPALIVIGLWIVLQFFSGIGSIAKTADTGGVAYMAHIGGFVAGFVLTFLFRGSRGTHATG